MIDVGVGICCVSGTGKEELAMSYAAETGFNLLACDRDTLMLPARIKLTTQNVIKAHMDILSLMESRYMEAGERFITDMTPVDIVAEMYSLFSWYSVPTEEEDVMIREVWDYACTICTKYLAIIMHIQPFKCGARQEQLNALTVGLIHTGFVNDIESCLFTVRRAMTDNESRLNALKHFVYGKFTIETPYGNFSSLKH